YVNVAGRIGPLLELGAGFHHDLTGYENIFLNASLLGMSREDVEQHLGSIVEFSGIREFIDTPIQTYSTGMAARLGFAIIAHSQPDILLVDEALSVGDAQFQARCEQAITRFLGNGTTMLLVSHDLVAIERICQRVVWLDHGRVHDQGPTRDILDSYRRFLDGAA
ncbi:MAG: ABC transporter ATP-binding protein, partial [Planctomycetota bacterium]